MVKAIFVNSDYEFPFGNLDMNTTFIEKYPVSHFSI